MHAFRKYIGRQVQTPVTRNPQRRQLPPRHESILRGSDPALVTEHVLECEVLVVEARPLRSQARDQVLDPF